MRVDKALLERTRREKGLKIKRVAALAGVPEGNTYQVFAGNNSAPDTVKKIAEALGVPMWVLPNSDFIEQPQQLSLFRKNMPFPSVKIC